MAQQNTSVLAAAIPGVLSYGIYSGLKSAGADPTFLYIFGGVAIFCGILTAARIIGEVKSNIDLRGLLKPKGTYGRIEHLNSHDPKSLGLDTDNTDGNGLPLGAISGAKRPELVYYKGDAHALIAGGTGAGKTSSLSKGMSVALGAHHNRIITSKGIDMAVSTYRYLSRTLKHHVVCIDPYRLLKPYGIKSDDYNPCDILVELAIRRSPEIFDKSREIALVLIAEEIGGSGENKVFRSVGRQFIAYILIHLAVEQAETGHLCCNLAFLNSLLNSGTSDLITLFNKMSISDDYDGAIMRAGKRFASKFKNAPKSAEGFLTETQEALAIFEPVTAIGQSCEHSTFNASDLKNPDTPTTIHIVLPPEKSGLNDIYAGLCLNSLLTGCIEADRFHPQVTVIADEFENLSTSPLPIIERVLKIGRTRGVRLIAFIQDQESLKARYGQLSSMFWTQSAIFMAFDIRSVDEAEEYSKRAGQRAIISDNASLPDEGAEFGVTIKEEGIPLMRPDAFTRMDKFKAVLFKEQHPLLMLDLVHYKMIDPFVHQIDDVPGAPPEQIFPITFKA